MDMPAAPDAPLARHPGRAPHPGDARRPRRARVLPAIAAIAASWLAAGCGNTSVTLFGGPDDTPESIVLSATGVGSGTSATLAWSGGPGGLTYRVERNGAAAANVGESPWTDRGLQAGQRYCWRVLGYSGWGWQARSNEACLGTDPGTAGWRVETVGPGRWPAVAVDASGEVHVCFVGVNGVGISYQRVGPGRSAETVDADGTAQCSVAVAADGTVHLAYLSRFGLRHATRASGTWTRVTVDAEALVGVQRFDGPALVLAADGAPRIAYRRRSAGASAFLAVATRSAPGAATATGGWSFDLTGIAGLVGPRSLTVDTAGVLRLASTDTLQQSAVAWRRAASGWVADYAQSLAPNRGDGPPLALDAAGAPRIAWWWRASTSTAAAQTLRWARQAASGWQFEDLASFAQIGTRVAASAAGGIDRVAVVDADGALRLFTRGASAWTAESPDGQGGAATTLDLAVGPDGQVRIVFDRAADGSVALASRSP